MERIKIILLGITCSIVCTITLLLCFSFFLTNNNFNEELIPVFLIVFFSLSILCGSIIMTRKIKKNGALYGASMSSIYIIALYAISSMYIGDFSIKMTSIYMITCGLILGAIGGVIGVNIK
ncbi:MAG: TIGR04086 family membrane protein [Clostridia bacterium]|nr:TIGR04086 family membrane protein [Clostridia bacterium]MBR3140845.1 TIGR04086 family membrane protein [Methanobrevibacter sp.]